ncbi:MAG: hypothetical protein WC528_04115 [Patescibacteria group bacterium]
MRQEFETDLRDFGQVAKEELNTEEKLSGGNFESLSAVSRQDEAAKRQHTSRETQREIYDIQKEKQKIMQALKEQLACLDNPEGRLERERGERTVSFDEAEGVFVYQDDRGRRQKATFGEIMTDMDWNVLYHLDKDSAPRPMVKKYLVERAKAKLSALLDLQIIKSESGSSVVHEKKQQAYRRIEMDRQSGAVKESWGLVSELIVKDFLKKLSLDKDFPFKIKEADVFQDVEEKIDFIIHLEKKKRGVNVETDEKAKDIGIQFTVSPEVAPHKEQQLQKARQDVKKQGERIDDIVLVVFPLKMASALQRQWRHEGRPAGGPDKFLYRQEAEKLFKELLQGVLKPEEIAQYWATVQNNWEEDPQIIEERKTQRARHQMSQQALKNKNQQ